SLCARRSMRRPRTPRRCSARAGRPSWTISRGMSKGRAADNNGGKVDPTLASLLGTLVGGGITYLLNRQAHAHQLAALREEFRTEYMAENTARHFLSHKSYTDRSFETLSRNLGG